MEDQLITSRGQHFICFGEILCRCLSDKPSAISLERMHATFRPIKHRLINKWIFGAAVGSVWSTASLLMVVDLFDSTKFFNAFFSLLSCCLFIIIASYTAVVVKMYCGTPPQHHGAVSRERKLTKTLLMVTTVSLLLSLPHIIFFFRSFLNVSSVPTNLSYRSSLPRHLNFLLFFLYYANSLANPILYAASRTQEGSVNVFAL